jgi:hypothetical protein
MSPVILAVVPLVVVLKGLLAALRDSCLSQLTVALRLALTIILVQACT